MEVTLVKMFKKKCCSCLSLLFHAQVLQVAHFTSKFLKKKKINFHVKLVTEQVHVVCNCQSLM